MPTDTIQMDELSIIVDTSGSMSALGKSAILRMVLGTFLEKLRIHHTFQRIIQDAPDSSHAINPQTPFYRAVRILYWGGVAGTQAILEKRYTSTTSDQEIASFHAIKTGQSTLHQFCEIVKHIHDAQQHQSNKQQEQRAIPLLVLTDGFHRAAPDAYTSETQNAHKSVLRLLANVNPQKPRFSCRAVPIGIDAGHRAIADLLGKSNQSSERWCYHPTELDLLYRQWPQQLYRLQLTGSTEFAEDPNQNTVDRNGIPDWLRS